MIVQNYDGIVQGLTLHVCEPHVILRACNKKRAGSEKTKIKQLLFKALWHNF